MTDLRKASLVALFLAILVWGGIGIYYFRFAPPPTEIEAPFSELTELTPESEIVDEFDEADFFVGNFQTWEIIPDSKDRYIILVNPETEKPFPKVRVGFDWSLLFGDGEREDATVWAILKEDDEHETLGYAKDFGIEKVDSLVKKGDFIKVVLKKEMMKGTAEETTGKEGKGEDGHEETIEKTVGKIIGEEVEGLMVGTRNQKDEQGHLLAHWFLIRTTN